MSAEAAEPGYIGSGMTPRLAVVSRNSKQIKLSLVVVTSSVNSPHYKSFFNMIEKLLF